MKQNQKRTKLNRIKKIERVQGNPMFGIPTAYVPISFYSPKEIHEKNMPEWCKLTKGFAWKR